MTISITKPTVGGSENTWGATVNTALDTIVDGINGTSGTIAPDLSKLTINGTDVTATAAELNKLDGVTATTAELNILDGVTATTAELNVLDGVVATTAEINYLDGVTSPIQTQINDIIAGETDGTVTSVGLSVPTGFAVSGSPVTTSGTLGLSFASGYSLLTSAQATSISNIPTATSQLTNDSGFITSQYTQPTSTGAVGTYAFLKPGKLPGQTAAGSTLSYTDYFGNAGSAAPSGTWRCNGHSTSGGGTVWLRIS